MEPFMLMAVGMVPELVEVGTIPAVKSRFMVVRLQQPAVGIVQVLAEVI
ncbi:MAG: hypothetical protein Q4C69_10290 [Lachnoclostridium edouardi]|nr:hypothetical protein [Lachnoclostridium edouardi]MDO4279209.1 hypothetical protein [Lachnoclostridium edouardi]